MKLSTKNIPDRIKSQVEVQIDIYGNEYIPDLRPIAGGSASKSGKLHEDMTEHYLYGPGREVIKKPKFECHFGLSRQGDFEIKSKTRTVHIECKQLGNAESHFDKLSHVFLNLICGCYGKEMWLVYDYNANILDSGARKIEALIERADVLKKQVALQGITFELILIDDLEDKMVRFRDFK